MDEESVLWLLFNVVNEESEVDADTSESYAHHRRMMKRVQELLSEVFKRQATKEECEKVLGQFPKGPLYRRVEYKPEQTI